MTNSKQLAGLIGPTMFAVGVTEAGNMEMFSNQIAPVVYLNGAVFLVAGLAIVRAHNVWTWRWPVIITGVGFARLVGDTGISGGKTLLTRAFDYRRIKSVGWILAALLLMPITFLLAYGVLRIEGRPLPDVQLFPLIEIAGFTLMFFVGAIGEELGWQGYTYAGARPGGVRWPPRSFSARPGASGTSFRLSRWAAAVFLFNPIPTH